MRNEALMFSYDNYLTLISQTMSAIYDRSESSQDVNNAKQVNQIFADIKSALMQIFHESNWLGFSKNELIEKLQSCKISVGFMKNPLESGESDITAELEFVIGTRYLSNILGLAIPIMQVTLDGLRETNELDLDAINTLGFTPFYRLNTNSIKFPANFLHNVVYSLDLPLHQIYSLIGFLIAHELSHAVGSKGISADKQGNFKELLGYGIKSEFERRAKLMQDQYSGIYLEVDNNKIYANGNRTLQENMADNLGLRLITMAYNKYVEKHGEEKKLPGLELSPKQLLHLGFANTMCSLVSETPPLTKNLLKYGAHLPAEVRINGALKNLEEFGKEWNCPVDPNGMNPPQSQRVRVW